MLTNEPNCYKNALLLLEPAERPVNLECRVVGFHHVGDHDLFIGEVLLEHVDEDKVNSKGERDESKLDPLIWLGRGFYRLGEKVGEHGL